jgi:hypothetical protein
VYEVTEMLLGHTCGWYCREGEGEGVHCDLIYASFGPRSWSEDDRRYVRALVREAYRDRYGWTVVEVEPAREAPPAPAYVTEQIAGSGPARHPYLVWYRRQ